MKSKSFKEVMPVSRLKNLPKAVSFAIAGSEFYVLGRVDWSKMTISNPIVTRHSEVKNTFKKRVTKKTIDGLPSNLTLAVVNKKGQEQPWEIILEGLNYLSFEAENLGVGRNDKKYWFYVMAEETDHLLPDYEIVFPEALGYLAPIFRFLRKGNVAKINGRRPISVEVAGDGGYIGSVTPGVTFRDGLWKALVQKDKNVSPDLAAVETTRAVRFSVDNPDRPSAPQHGIGYPLHVVDLYPSFIASAGKTEKARVKNLVYEYTDDFVPSEGQELVPIMDLIHLADVPGFSALYQWMTFRFAEHLAPSDGVREEPAKFETDTNISYGPKKVVHLIRHKETWTVLEIEDPKGRFLRNGEATPSISCDIDPISLGDPEKVHRLPPINPNNKRVAGSETQAGLIPVEVREYDARKVDVSEYEERTLCDFSYDGNAIAQAILFEWILWVYGPAFQILNPLAK